jgi:GDP-mannose 6-dehydrogenase
VPKDLRAFLAAARARSLRLPLLENMLPSNVSQIDRVVDIVLATGARHIGLHGIAFKPGTDDLRESPLVELAERLLGKGKRLVVFDEQVKMARLFGGNRSYIDEKLPHLAELLTDRLGDLRACELILLGHATSDARVEEWLQAGKQVIDLTGTRSGQSRPGLSCIV